MPPRITTAFPVACAHGTCASLHIGGRFKSQALLDAKQFTYLAQNFELPFKNLVGAAHHMRKACESIGQNWVNGMSQCEKFFSSS